MMSEPRKGSWSFEEGEETEKLRFFITAIACLGPIFATSPQIANESDRLVEARLKKEALSQEVMGPRTFALPQCRLYDVQGRQVADLGADYSESFRGKLEAALKSPAPTKSEKSLKWEVDRLEGMAGKKLPESDFTVILYWAEWCKPCETQLKVVKDIVNSHRELRINILHVETDPQKVFPEIFKKR